MTTTNEITLKPSAVAAALRICLNANQPTVLWGAPGVGKSQLVQQTAAAESLACQDVRAVLLDPVDLRGLPHVNGDGRAHWDALTDLESALGFVEIAHADSWSVDDLIEEYADEEEEEPVTPS